MRTTSFPLALVLLLLAACASDPPAQQPDAAAPCGGACGPGTTCSAGRCVAVEVDAAVDDGPGLEVAPLDGTAEASTPDAAGCPEGSDPCGVVGACFSFATSREHCGGCAYECPAWSRCNGGRCAPSWNLGDQCPAGEADCDRMVATGCEVQLRIDPTNCGACGRACAMRERCESGRCVAP